MKVPCEHCGKQLDPNSIFCLQKTVGYERKVSGGSRKGGSDIINRRHLQEWACSECVEKLRRKVAPLQQSFGGGVTTYSWNGEIPARDVERVLEAADALMLAVNPIINRTAFDLNEILMALVRYEDRRNDLLTRHATVVKDEAVS